MKNLFSHSTDKQGYTLVEVVAVVAMVMFAGTFLVRLSASIKGRGQFSTTDNRLMVIEAKIKQYYLAHERLPVNGSHLPPNEVPLDISTLDLEQKYRLDGWGNPFQYTAGTVDPATGTYIDLQDVNGFAASVIGRGPDQIIGTNDDITSHIDLSVEAEQVVQKKLKLLGEKVATYDALFAGIDNDGVNIDNPANPNRAPFIDEDPLDGANTGSFSTGCPPVAGFTNDPASGLPTLDNIEIAMDGGFGDAYSCDNSVVNPQLAYHLATYYHLPTGFPGGYDFDPWGNPILWGYIGRQLDDGTSIPDSMDFHYHKFFSSGPDSTIVDDDIIYNGQ